jgi:multidrug resistance protein, MATE family
VSTSPTTPPQLPGLPAAARIVSTPGGELLAQWRLAMPLAAQQIGLQLMGAVDTALLGHYHSNALAGVGVGNSLVFAITCTAMGVVLGLDSVVPRAIGAGDHDAADRALFAGLRLAILVGIPTSILVLASRWALPFFGAAPQVAAEAHSYLVGRSFGEIPFLLSVAMRAYLAAHGETRSLMVAVIGGNLINFAGSYLLIFGDAGLHRLGLPGLGIPELGSFGAALATTLVQLATMIMYAIAIVRLRRSQGRRTSLRRLARDSVPPRKLRGADRAAVPFDASAPAPGHELRAIAYHGIPIGLHLLAEVGVFAAAGILAARFGTESAAAHSVAITLASFTFSAAVGIGSATAVRVGLALGAGGHDARALARRRGFIGVGLGIAVMALGSLCFLLFPRQLVGAFTDRPEVLATAVPLLGIAALFQLSDGIQAVGAGALRGAGDTRSTMWANLLGHYGIGLPISLALGFGAGMGARGLWWGLSAGLSVTAAILIVRFLHITRATPTPPAPP